MKCLLTAILLLLPVAANAQGAPPRQLTVYEAMSVGNALRQLGPYAEIVNGQATGRSVNVPFEFGGATLMNFATDIDSADRAQRNYQKIYKDLFAKYAKPVLDDKGKETGTAIPANKVAEFNDKTAAAMDAPSGQVWVRFKEADLCMDKKDACKGDGDKPIINHIPPGILAAIVPLVDR